MREQSKKILAALDGLADSIAKSEASAENKADDDGSATNAKQAAPKSGK
jgi:hypothetical protein